MAKYEKLDFEIKGMLPILMHNGTLADPDNSITIAIKKITDKKKNKTAADMEKLGDLEFLGGLYLNEKDEVIIPGEIIEKVLHEGAKKSSKGPQVLCGVMCKDNPLLIYDGPKTATKLIKDHSFRHECMVVISKSRVKRIRPIFKNWGLKFSVSYDPDITTEKVVRQALIDAGRLVGMGDWRPKYGRFEVM